jgi:ABC-type transport system involved in cytochrome c biogenesis permease component
VSLAEPLQESTNPSIQQSIFVTFLPIVERELRVAARRPGTYWSRFGAGLGIMLVWQVLVAVSGRTATPQLSQGLFIAFGVMALGFCLLAGIFLTADCLSEEKREGTLGLLFLADLKSYDVVLGKLIATSTHSVYGLLAVFPVLGLPLLMGGVTVGEFWRVVLVLLATLFLSLSLGMFVSALSHEARQAMAGTLFGMLLLAGVLPALYWLPVHAPRAPHWTAVLFPCPAFAFRAALDDYFRTPSGSREFWASLQVIFWLGAVFLSGSVVMLPRALQDTAQVAPHRPASGGRHPAEPWLELARRAFPTFLKILPESVVVEMGTAWRRKRKHLLEMNPYQWLASRDGVFEKVGGLVVGLLLLLWFGSLAISFGQGRRNGPPWDFIISMFTAYALHQVVKYAAATEACRRLCEDRRNGALELLLVTPLREAAIIEGQLAALRGRLAGLGRLLVIVNLGLMGAVVLWHEHLDIGYNDWWMFMELFLGGILVAYSDLRAIGELGVLMALRGKRHNREVLATLGCVLLPSWFAIFVLLSWLPHHNISEAEGAMIFASWFGVGIITDLIMIARARSGLGRGIRHWLNEAGARRGVSLNSQTPIANSRLPLPHSSTPPLPHRTSS